MNDIALLLCISNHGADDLQRLKIYRALADAEAEAKGFRRVIDESGEDYLYPASSFLELPLPTTLRQRIVDLAALPSR